MRDGQWPARPSGPLASRTRGVLPGAPVRARDPDHTVADLLRMPAMWAFILTTACIEFCRGALFISLLPAYLTGSPDGLGWSVAAVGLVISGQYLADTVCKAPAGWLVDRFGPWRVLFPSLTLAAVAVYLLPHVHSLGLVALLAFLFGMGASANWPAVLSGSVALGGMRSRASATSITFLAWLAGGGPGPVLINFLIGRGYGAAFALLAVVATGGPVVAAIGWSGALGAVRLPPRGPSPDLRETARDMVRQLRAAGWLLPGMFVQMLALGIILPVLVPFARTHLHLASQAEYGMMLLAGGAVTVAFLMPFGRMVDRTGSRRPLIAGFGLGAAAVALLAFAHGGPGLLWRVCLLGFSYALILPAWNGLTVGKVDSGRRGLVLGLFMAIEGLGIASGSALGGTLYTAAFRAPFLATAAILAAMALFYGFVPRQHFEAPQEGGA